MTKYIQIQNYIFRITWIKNYIKKNIDKYIKNECKRQEYTKANMPQQLKRNLVDDKK